MPRLTLECLSLAPDAIETSCYTLRAIPRSSRQWMLQEKSVDVVLDVAATHSYQAGTKKIDLYNISTQ